MSDGDDQLSWAMAQKTDLIRMYAQVQILIMYMGVDKSQGNTGIKACVFNLFPPLFSFHKHDEGTHFA